MSDQPANELLEELRPAAFGIAYRMLGSVAEAEDVAQEALLRLHGATGVENPAAFVTTATTRLAIDVLRSARVRRETYTGSWLPEPLVEAEDDAARRIEDEEEVSLAFLLLLERLRPDERAVLVLRESFDYPFDEIAEIVGKSRPTAARSSAARGAGSPTSARASTPTRSTAARSRPASSPPPAAATWTGSSRCSRPTPCSSATGAARRARSPPRWSAPRASPARS